MLLGTWKGSEAWWKKPENAVKASLFFVFSGAFLLAALGLIWPPIGGFSQLFLALILLEVPLRMERLEKGKKTGQDLYLGLGSWKESLRLGLLTVILVFPLYFTGFHFVQTKILGGEADWKVANLSRFSEDWEFAPNEVCDDAHVQAWTQKNQLWITPKKDQSLTASLPKGSAPLGGKGVSCQGKSARAFGHLDAHVETEKGQERLVYEPPKGQGLMLLLGEGEGFSLELSEGGEAIPRGELRIGPRGKKAQADGHLEGSPGHLWIVLYLLVQLLLVAYPEETFFRGYLLPKLQEKEKKRLQLFGVGLGRGLLYSALAFALLHPILIPGAYRLLVFFPALLFGFLAMKQRAIGSAILVHALSNLALAVVSRMYI